MIRGAVLAALTAVVIAGWPQAGFPQPQAADELKALRKDVEAIKQGQTAIQKDLQDIKNLLQPRPTAAAPPPEAVVNIAGARFKGDKNAKVTLVDFTDYQ